MRTTPTVWHFDNCACVVAFTRDVDTPPDVRSEIWDSTIRTCPEHAQLSGDELFQFVREENNRASITRGIALDVNPDIGIEGYEYSYDQARVLEVSFLRVVVSPEERALIQSAADIQIGPGKVRVL